MTITVLKDGKKMIPLRSGTVLLIGVREDGPNVYICNTGECPTETNDTVVLAAEEIDDVITTLSDVKKEMLSKVMTAA